MSNVTHTTLYVGMSTFLLDRVRMHRDGVSEGFAGRYKCTKLLYYELLHNREAAYLREAEIKGWRRQKKVLLITSKNPSWKDVFDDLVRDVEKLL